MTVAEQLIAKWTAFEAALKHAFRDYDKKDVLSFLKAHRITNIDVQQMDTIRNIRNALAHPSHTKDGKPFFQLNENVIFVLDEAIHAVKSLPKVVNIAISLEDTQVCRLDDEISVVVTKMIKQSYSNVPVLNDWNHVIGVLSESVMLRLGVDVLGAKRPKKIRDIMAYLGICKNTRRPDDFFFVDEDEPIISLYRKCHEATMNNKRAEMFFVTKDGKRKNELKGIVTIWDIVKLIDVDNVRDHDMEL